MCKKIESSFILIHQLKNRKSCTIKDLVHKKIEIEEKFPSIFVDVCKKSVLNSISCFPEVFKWENDKISKNDHSDEYFKEPLISYFNTNIEDQIKEDIEKILEFD